MTDKVACYAAKAAKKPLEPWHIERRELTPTDIKIAIMWSGICHSDVHQARAEWSGASFPMVPGHEILGRVEKVGAKVKSFAVGDTVGVGCMVNACGTCSACGDHNEQFCDAGAAFTYNSTEADGKTQTYGGYSTHVVVDERFVLRIPKNLDPAGAAPLLCAGITTYSPLKRYKAGPHKKVAVMGLGGLGHMAVKLSHALGAHTTVLTHSPGKKEDAKRLGADEVIVMNDPKVFERHAKQFDIIINTVSAKHDLKAYMGLLRYNSAMVMLGMPEEPLSVGPGDVVGRGLSFGGSLIGGIKETQEMLDFCGKHNLTCEVEKISAHQINEAYDRMVKNDIKYRFVIDATTF